jgi:hypothetical protein
MFRAAVMVQEGTTLTSTVKSSGSLPATAGPAAAALRSTRLPVVSSCATSLPHGTSFLSGSGSPTLMSRAAPCSDGAHSARDPGRVNDRSVLVFCAGWICSPCGSGTR